MTQLYILSLFFNCHNQGHTEKSANFKHFGFLVVTFSKSNSCKISQCWKVTRGVCFIFHSHLQNCRRDFGSREFSLSSRLGVNKILYTLHHFKTCRNQRFQMMTYLHIAFRELKSINALKFSSTCPSAQTLSWPSVPHSKISMRHHNSIIPVSKFPFLAVYSIRIVEWCNHHCHLLASFFLIKENSSFLVFRLNRK